MKLPNGEQASIDERKVREYLLSPSHPVGRFKLKFFAGIGFGPDNWRPFIAALAELAEKGEARIAEEGEFRNVSTTLRHRPFAFTEQSR